MIKLLSIRNVLLIDKIDLSFNYGLCVLTGETGAGKSMILESLNLISGERAKSSLRPEQGKIASVTAVVNIMQFNRVKEKLTELDLEFEDEILVKRTITDDGKSKCYINENIVTTSTLKLIFNHIIEIHSQFSEQGLLDTNTHIDILDNFGEHLNNTNQLNDLWKELNGVKKEFEELKLKNENQKNIRDSLEFDINELNLLSPKEDEFNNLKKKKLILQNSAKISENINSVINNFQSENPPGIEYLLSQVIKKLDEVKELLDSETQKNIENFNSIYLETIEFSKNIKNLINDDFNNNSLEEIEDKIQLYKKIAKKHNVTENELITLSSILSSKLEESFFSGKELEEKEKTLKNFEEKYLKLSNNLSKLRKNNAAKLDNEINNELPLLKLENASFKTFIEKCDPGHKGIDKVIFKIRTNPKSEMGLIKNISSGGELCRFALAIKVIAEKKKPTVMVFDEVDSGIGGAVSSSVGERLKKLGESRQVIVVTHSPQVAAFGNDHFIVEKINSYNEVKISVKKINSEEKINEVARMLSGKKITDEAISAARKLIEN